MGEHRFHPDFNSWYCLYAATEALYVASRWS